MTTYRRFRPRGATGKARQLIEDPHGSFMLHTDHVGILRNEQERTRMWEIACQQRDTTIAQLREELKRVTSPDREPDYYAVVEDHGHAVDLLPSLDLAEAQSALLRYRTGRGHHLAKLWGTIG